MVDSRLCYLDGVLDEILAESIGLHGAHCPYQRDSAVNMCFALGGRASPDDNAVHVLFEVPRPVKARSSATEYGVLVGKTPMYNE
jgi:hypothetical protein